MALKFEEIKKTHSKEDQHSLHHEAKDARHASRELDIHADSPSQTDLVAALARLENLIRDYNHQNRQLSEETKSIIAKSEAATENAEKLTTFLNDHKNAMQDVILAGIGDAISEMAQAARKEIEDIVHLTNNHIVSLEQESRRQSTKKLHSIQWNKTYSFLKVVTLFVWLIIGVWKLLQLCFS